MAAASYLNAQRHSRCLRASHVQPLFPVATAEQQAVGQQTPRCKRRCGSQGRKQAISGSSGLRAHREVQCDVGVARHKSSTTVRQRASDT
jgi:hypothetical protein